MLCDDDNDDDDDEWIGHVLRFERSRFSERIKSNTQRDQREAL